MRDLEEIYAEFTGDDPDIDMDNDILMDALSPFLCVTSSRSLRKWLREYDWLAERIAIRAGHDSLYMQPAVLVAYMLADERPLQLQDVWPLSTCQLRCIFSDIGARMEH